ncbi:DUF2283 domain-containing protein [Candidatus Pacearchaeota archaeon]|nr:DUF2283 domain-containing protein [Candidatus Pacearchaeota archaeon]
MKITFDKEADAVYIEISGEDFFNNRKIDNETIIDLDKNGKIIGIELLNVSKRMSKDFLSDIRVQNLAFSE